LPVLILSCPRLSPDWELHALRALVKPQTGAGLYHKNPNQLWRAGDGQTVATLLKRFAEVFGYEAVSHQPDSGDFHLLIEVDQKDAQLGRALAVLMSRHFADRWFALDRLYLKDGRFYRRSRRYKLQLRPASDVHLPKPLRAQLRGLLPCKTSPSNV